MDGKGRHHSDIHVHVTNKLTHQQFDGLDTCLPSAGHTQVLLHVLAVEELCDVGHVVAEGGNFALLSDVVHVDTGGRNGGMEGGMESRRIYICSI